MVSIQFASDGWFGVISDQISFENMTIVAQGVADYLNERNEKKDKEIKVVLAYDTRFLSRDYAWAIQRVLTGNRIRVYLHKNPVPTSFLSLATKLYKANLGIMVTGQNRPARYSGLAFRSSQGRPVTSEFMTCLFNYLYRKYPRYADEDRELLSYIDVLDPYRDLVTSLVNLQIEPGQKPLLVVSDSCFGSVLDYLKDILKAYGINPISIRTKPNPGFMDLVPCPNQRNMQAMSRLIRRREANIGLFFSGDGSGLGVLDSRGDMVEEQWIYAIVLGEWLKIRQASSTLYTDIFTPSILSPIQMSNRLLDQRPLYQLARDQDMPDPYIVWDRQGLYFSEFIPDLDGIFEALLFLSALISHRGDWYRLVNNIQRTSGIRTYLTRSISIANASWKRKKAQLESYNGLAGLGRIINIEQVAEDLKLWFMDGSWAGLAYRPSEDRLTIYYDAPGQRDAEADIGLLTSFLTS
jgi:phosphomannomutase